MLFNEDYDLPNPKSVNPYFEIIYIYLYIYLLKII